MRMKWLAGALVRVVVSLLFAGLFYTGWLAAFLGPFKDSAGAAKAVLWILAPGVTATGFAAGMMIGSRAFAARRETFTRAMIWPLAGCVLGAVSVVWFGPMLIVFGMFTLGTGSVALREVVQLRSVGLDKRAARIPEHSG